MIAFDPSGSNVYAGENSGGTVAADIAYTIGATAINFIPKYSAVKAFATCPLTAEFLVLNESTNQWEDDSSSAFTNAWISDFKTAAGAGFKSGKLVINETAGAYKAEVIKYAKIRLHDPLSNYPGTSGASAESDVFKITVTHTCENNTFSITSANLQ